MRTCCTTILLLLALMSPIAVSHAAAQATSTAPTIIPLSGRLLTATGEPRTGTVVLAISLFDGQNDPSARFVETTLPVTLDAQGGYSVQFGSTFAEGLPPYLFTDDPGARWIAIGVSGEPDPPPAARFMLVSVPYAAKAGTAETLGGKPVSDFVLASSFRDDLRTVLEEEGVKTSSSSVSTEATTAHFIPKYTMSPPTLEDSVIYQSGTSIGIGTTSPDFPFTVNGEIASVGTDAAFRLSRTSGATFLFVAGSGSSATQLRNITNNPLSFWTNNSEKVRIDGSGNVGIGVTAPDFKLDVNGEIASTGPDAGFRLQRTSGATFLFLAGSGTSPTQLRNTTNNGLSFWANNSEKMRIDTAGNVGIGTTSPTSTLHVVGGALVTGSLVVDGNIAAKYQDVAEWVDAAEPLEAGTIVVIDTTAKNRVAASKTSYDVRVAGAVSPQPGLTLGEPGEGKALVAQSGRVRIKVDASFGAIRPGDLLVTSPTKGHAMRSKSVSVGGQALHRPGTVIGKALEPLASGRGEILALLTLQ